MIPGYNHLSQADQDLIRKAYGQRWEDIDPTKAESEECRIALDNIARMYRMAEDMRQDDIDSRMDGWEEDYNRIERPY